MAKFTIEPAEVLTDYRVVAVVGASKNPEKDANSVPAYLQARDYTIIPINPTADTILGVKAYHSLDELPDTLAKTVEILDVFRPSEEFPQVAMAAVKMKERTGRPFVFWGQLGLENEEAKKILAGAGIDYIMDRCMRTEHQMLPPVEGRGRKINLEWHDVHPMPQRPTREQRVRWHFEHAAACGCRPIPENLKADVEALRKKDKSGRSD